MSTGLARYDAARRAWVTAARWTFVPSEREPCWVCGRFKSITQSHHVVPLTTQYDRGFKLPHHEHVWLCPNHHVMAHMFIPSDSRSMAPRAMRARDKSAASLNADLSEDEFEKMLELMRRSAVSEALT